MGAYIGAIVGFILILSQSPLQAFIFLIFLIVLQLLENSLIFPKVVGKSVGLPGIWMLAAVSVFSSVFGITGILIGVPFTATLYKLINEDITKRSIIRE